MQDDFYDIKNVNRIINNIYIILYYIKKDVENENDIIDINKYYILMMKNLKIINRFINRKKGNYYLQEIRIYYMEIKTCINCDFYLEEYIKKCKKQIKTYYNNVVIAY